MIKFRHENIKSSVFRYYLILVGEVSSIYISYYGMKSRFRLLTAYLSM